MIDSSPSMKNRKGIPCSYHDAFVQNSNKRQLMETNLSVAADLWKKEWKDSGSSAMLKAFVL